jgi:hypothetical protein
MLACAPVARGPFSPPAPWDPLSEAALRADLFALAADSFRGRETGTEDAVRAARFLAARIAAYGLEPAGDSGFLQRVPLRMTSLARGTAVVVAAGADTARLDIPAQVFPLVALDPGLPLPRLSVAADLEFAGDAISLLEGSGEAARAREWEGKAVVVVVSGPPPEADSIMRAALDPLTLGRAVLRHLVPARPAAIVVLFAGNGADFYPPLVASRRLEASQLQPTHSAAPERQFPMVIAGLAHPGSSLLPSAWPIDAQPQPLTGRRLIARAAAHDTIVNAYNVVAVVRGRDSARAGRYVVFSAHYDHLGIVPPPTARGDSIANGADDDGSGTVTLLALAGAWARRAARLDRSVLFIWHTGEEKGLLGSAYAAAHPRVPLDSVVALINVDMVGRNARDSLYVVGPAAAPGGRSRFLGDVVDSANARLSRPFVLSRAWDSATHPERAYYRSDHYSYAVEGVPVMFVTSGRHPDYHRVTDSPDRIDYEKLARVAQLLFGVGDALANDAAARGRTAPLSR